MSLLFNIICKGEHFKCYTNINVSWEEFSIGWSSSSVANISEGYCICCIAMAPVPKHLDQSRLSVGIDPYTVCMCVCVCWGWGLHGQHK